MEDKLHAAALAVSSVEGERVYEDLLTALAGILGVEDRPLVSADFTNDTRSGIVDAPSTMVIDGSMLKVLVWYDNEYGYVHRLAELAADLARARPDVLFALGGDVEVRVEAAGHDLDAVVGRVHEARDRGRGVEVAARRADLRC